MGSIKECTVEIAKVIDEAINSSKEDCQIPLTVLDPAARSNISSLKDYYLVTVEFTEDGFVKEFVDKHQ